MRKPALGAARGGVEPRRKRGTIAKDAIAQNSPASLRLVSLPQPLPPRRTASEGNHSDTLSVAERGSGPSPPRAPLGGNYFNMSRASLIFFTYPFLWSEHDEALHHKRRYSRPRVTELLAASGFMVRRASYCISFSFPIIVAYRACTGGR